MYAGHEMRSILTMAAAAALLGVLVGARQSAAKPCPGDAQHNQRLALVPTGLVTADGAITAEGGTVSSGPDNILLVTGPRRLIRWLARRVEVKVIERYAEPHF